MAAERAYLTGNAWTPQVVGIVVGRGGDPVAPGEDIAVTGVPASRAKFLARVMGFPAADSKDDNGAFVEIDGATTLDADILVEAADEIMGYYGRIKAGILVPRRQMILSRAVARLNAAQAPAPASLRSTHGVHQVETLDVAAQHEGFFLTRTYQLRHPQFQGGKSEVLTREVFVATDAAIVLPYDPVRDRILLVEQFRMGPFGRGDPLPWVLEPVAGRVDAGETPDETARRECIEEADLPLDRLEHVSSHYCSPGCSTEVFHCFVGLCALTEPGRSHGGLDSEHEDLRRHVIGFERAMELMTSGEINIGPLFALLLWLERERPRLRALS